MQQAQTIVSLVHSLRKKHNLKVRQPLTKLIIPVASEAMQAQIEAVADLILAEINVKQITYIAHTSNLVAKKVKPNFKQIGQRYKAQIKPITEALTTLTQEEILLLEAHQELMLNIGGDMIRLSLEDVMIISEDIPGWSVASHEGITVALDITVTNALKQEGIARDVVNKIQNMRKAMGLEVQDKIQLDIASQETFVKEAVTEHQAYICQETQALQFKVVDSLNQGEQVEIENYMLCIKVTLQPII